MSDFGRKLFGSTADISDSLRARHTVMRSDLFMRGGGDRWCTYSPHLKGKKGENTYSHHSSSRTARGGGEVERLNRAYGVKKSRKRSVAWRR